MNISHDYSYLGSGKKLIEMGYADLGIHSLNFDRFLTEEEQQQNLIEHNTLTSEQWNERCDEFSRRIYEQMLPIAELLNEKYDMHQYTKENSSMTHYRSDWDLFFYSNRGWNKRDYFDHMQISFNEKRVVEQNHTLLQELLTLLRDKDTPNVSCRVQYDAVIHTKELKEKSDEICEKNLGKFIEYNGRVGKIKIVDQQEESVSYGFFHKGSKRKYYSIDPATIVLRDETLLENHAEQKGALYGCV